MPDWMVKGKALNDYLNACTTADVSAIQDNPVLMRMFNKEGQYKVVMERLVSLFGPLDNLRICEIGGGYGGQAKIICSTYKPATYHIIDLPEVCELQCRYLGYNISMTKPSGQEYDLVISNYALSEIPDNKLYIDEVVKKSKHGYITCNTDLVKLDFRHYRIPDVPGERKTNYVLWW